MDRRRLGAVVLRAVLAVEDAVQALLVQVVGRSGRRQVTVLPFVGHGSPDVLHVRARVVLGSAATHAAAADAAERRVGSRRGGRFLTLRESLAPFFTVELPRARVVVSGPAGDMDAVADRQGYLDATVAGGLAPGWHEVTVTARWRGHSAAAQVPVLVVDPAARVGVVSDLDDTVIETGLTRGIEFLRITLLTSVTERAPRPGAAELYRAIAARPDHGAQRPVFYLSTSPWNLYELLSRFIALRNFPAGPLLLTDWGPSRTNLLRVTAEEHKLTLIRALLAEHRGLSVVLVGDTGQLDPEIYAAVALEAPDRVTAVYVRRTPHITPARAIEVGGLARRVAAVGVPMLLVEDSVQIARHAAGLGLLDDADVESVRRASPV